MANVVLCRLGGEITIKGGNRAKFEKILEESILRQVGGRDRFRFDRARGRLYLRRKDRADFPLDDLAFLQEALGRVLGLSSFSFAQIVSSTWDSILSAVDRDLPAVLSARDPGGRGLSFRVRSRRSDKLFLYTSQEMDGMLADRIRADFPHLRLDLSGAADLTVGVEVRENNTAVFFDQHAGPGGMPVGTADSALALLSAGIDSPVAAWHLMRRGCYVNYLTFHSSPYTPPETIEAVAALVLRLNAWQRRGQLVGCNLAPAQKMIRDACSERFRTVLYRRLMMRVAGRVAASLGDRVLVTGECINQVASQTLANMSVIDAAADLLVLRPLIALDKQDIISAARKLGTLEISERGCIDACTVFAPENPATNSPIARIIEEESRLDYADMLATTLATVTRIDPVTCRQYPLPLSDAAGASMPAVAADGPPG